MPIKDVPILERNQYQYTTSRFRWEDEKPCREKMRIRKKVYAATVEKYIFRLCPPDADPAFMKPDMK